MIFEKLTSTVSTFTHIIHVADIHIRLTKRHGEYREVFQRFYDDVKKSPETTVVVIAGDIVHSKVDLSPECVQMVSDFLKSLSDLRPTVVIPGNHDCYSPDHEILTRRGWVKIEKYVNEQYEDELATFNQNTEEIEFQVPSNRIAKKFKGELYHLTGKNVDLMITPTHQVLYHWNQTDKFYKKEAKDITLKSEIPINGKINSYAPDLFYKLLGFSFAEGTFVFREHITKKNKFDGCRVQFHIKCEREIKYLSYLLNELNYKFSLRPQKDGTYYIVVYSELGKRICEYFDAKKEIPINILSSSPSQMKSFVEGYLHGDGSNSKQSPNKWRFSSISEKSIDILHTLIRIIGGRSNKDKRIIFGNYENSKQQYGCNAFINNKVNFSCVRHIEKIPYDGMVYCVTVPNTNLLIRRNNQISICGNCTLANKSRLDSLSPIVEALNHSKLHYLKETKLYGLGNILFNNMSIFDDSEKYIRGIDIPEIYKNEYKHIVALFHGPVDRAVTDTGFSISNPSIMPELFDWHHIALLGDIHKRQNIQESRPEKHKPCIHYPSSLIQQNHGETLNGHGYTVWDLEDYSYKYVDVPNDYGYFTVDVHQGKILTDLSELPKKTYLRIRYVDSILSEVKSAEAEISKLTEIFDPVRVRVESEKDKKAKENKVCDNVKLSEIANVDYQSTLIEEYLKTKLNVQDQAKIDRILIINREINGVIKKDDFSRSLKWTPVRFEWDNMFSYGEENFIDFTKMSGVYGIFGPNTCGKSSIFSAMCFCLFDKWERGFKAIVAKNVAKDKFRCKFEFEIGGIHYFIEKVGETTKSGNVKVQVNFWREVDGKNEDLTDVMRRKTNDVIKDYIGSFEDFILTTLSIQNTTKNNISFINMGNTERKDLLVQFMGLNVFDRIYEEAYARGKDLAAKLKQHKDKNYIQDLDDSEKMLDFVELSIKECNDSIIDLSGQIKNVNDSIVEETGKLITLDKDVPTDIEYLNSRRNGQYISLNDLKTKLDDCRESLSKKTEVLNNLNKTLSGVDVEELIEAHNKYKELRRELEGTTRKCELKRIDITGKLDKLKKLSVYEYDPECEYCMKNVFVVDARNTEKGLKVDQKEMEELEKSVELLQEQSDKWNWSEEAYQNYTILLNNQSKAKDEYNTINTSVLLLEKDIEKTSQVIKETERKIELYHKNQIAVDNNQKVNMNILSFKNALNKLEVNLNNVNKKLLELTGKRGVLKKQIQVLNDTILDIMTTEEERELFDYYCQAVGRNGIPYQVICNTIPEITREINSLLSQTTDFTLEIEYDDKNIIPYVNYASKGRWPIEMTSGFERFVVSIAIRVALSNISSLPKTSFLVIDEGFSALDPANLSSMPILFDYLKHHFEFVFIISHNEVLRDFVEKQIEIKVDGNFSKVEYE